MPDSGTKTPESQNWLPPFSILRPGAWPAGFQKIQLSFDDGPTPETPELARLLARHGVKATFFLAGSCVRKFPEAVRTLHEEGHVIGNHSFSHRLQVLNAAAVDREIQETDEAIAGASGISGFQTRWFRPPFGILTPAIHGSRLARAKRTGTITFFLNDTHLTDRNWRAFLKAFKQRIELSRGASVVLHEAPYRHGEDPVPRPWLPEAVEELLVWARGHQYGFVTGDDFPDSAATPT